MSKGIAITGMGIISSIGNTVAENLSSLRAAKPGITRLDLIETRHRDAIMVGEIKKSNAELETQIGLAKDNNLSRTSMLGIIAAREAIEQASIDDIDAYRTGFISGTSVGGMDMTERYYTTYQESPEFRKYIATQHAGATTGDIARHLGIRGYVTTISTACSSAANAIMLGARMIKAGKLDRVIVGGTDGMSKFTVNGFGTLMILSDEACTPFDENRKGLNLGEAAAYIVLESDKVVKRENKKVLGYVSGWANANDAFHQTASSAEGEGAYLAMKEALEIAEITPDAIDYVNVHGTATPNNDMSEGTAMLRIFGKENIPVFSSTKAFTGHTLAAAASVEAVFSLLSLQENMVFPNLNFKTPIEALDMTPQTTCLEKELNVILSNSFGFGGNCSTLIFTKA